MRFIAIIGVILTGLMVAVPATALAQEELMPSIEVKEGFVPNEKVAIEIAVAIWKPLFGEKEIRKQRPYKAELMDGVWHVRGHLPDGHKGGTALARINKSDGRILFVNHGR